MLYVYNAENCNIGSVCKALTQLNIPFITFDKANEIAEDVKAILLPGVSTYDAYIKSLKNIDLFQFIVDNYKFGHFRLIGICAGAQVLFESSEEGNERGLRLFPGRLKKIATSSNIKVPHLGWNKIVSNENHPMAHFFDGIDLTNKKFYFSHSYRFPDSEHALAYVDYGERFPVVVAKDNLIAIQFHPEKSYGQGLQLLKNICEL